ncbi:MAG: hypothetical protein WDN04_13790 [Rhodospirillales bacterium]
MNDDRLAASRRVIGLDEGFLHRVWKTLQRLRRSAQDLAGGLADPGSEAMSAIYCAERLEGPIEALLGPDVAQAPTPPPCKAKAWVPMSNPTDIRHIGKFQEELNEAGTAASRCLIQGIDEREPETGKLNREWLEDEIADVRATSELAIEHFELDEKRIRERAARKKLYLRSWHAKFEGGTGI